jgi:hypothetical protein
MRNVVRLLTSLAPLALGACGGDDYSYPGYRTPPPGTYANLQIIAASIDAPPIDIILDGKVFVAHLDYGQGTAEQPITPTSHTLVVQIETPGKPTTVLGPTTLDAAANTDYVVTVEGTVGSIQTPGLSLVTSPHQLAVVPTQSTRIQVLNAYNAAISVYLTAPGAAFDSSMPLGAAPVGGFADLTEVSAGEWELWITFPGGCGGSHDLGPIVLEGGSDVALAVLPPVFPPGEFLPIPLPCGITSASAVDASGNTSWVSSVGSLRVINDSPDAPALAITANGNLTRPVVASLSYEAFTDYLGISALPGAYDLAITPASNLRDVLASQAVYLDAGGHYTLYALGPLAHIFPFITRDDYRGYATQARLRFIQGSPTAQLVDVYLTASGAGIENATPTYAAMPFAADTGYVSYMHGSYELTVTSAGSKTPIIGPVAVTLDDMGIYTAVARDAPGGGTPYGLIELDDFLPVIGAY